MTASVKVEDKAGGPWIVMVHGMSQDHRAFSAQVAAFRARHRLLMIDLPGHGLAGDVAGPYGHLEFAAHAVAEIEAAGLDRFACWGTHTGATIAPLVASRLAGSVAAMVLEAPAIPGQNQPVATETIGRAKATARAHGVAAAIDEWWQRSCWFEAMRADPVARRADQHRAMVSAFGGRPWLDDHVPAAVTDGEAALRVLAAPTLIYTGNGDHPDFQRAADRIAKLVRQAHRAHIPDAGGFPGWERPGPVNALVGDFLDNAG